VSVNETGEDSLIASEFVGIVWHRTMPTRLRLSVAKIRALKKNMTAGWRR